MGAVSGAIAGAGAWGLETRAGFVVAGANDGIGAGAAGGLAVEEATGGGEARPETKGVSVGVAATGSSG